MAIPRCKKDYSTAAELQLRVMKLMILEFKLNFALNSLSLQAMLGTRRLWRGGWANGTSTNENISPSYELGSKEILVRESEDAGLEEEIILMKKALRRTSDAKDTAVKKAALEKQGLHHEVIYLLFFRALFLVFVSSTAPYVPF